MKRIVCYFYLKIVPLILVLAVFVSAEALAQQQEENTVAIVIKINGSLEYREQSGGDWKPAKIKQGLYHGYQLRTSVGDKAIIVYTSGTRVLVNENTELEIEAQTPPGSNRKPTLERTKLLVGEVYSTIGKRAEPTSYEVETPSSVASVRGTKFNSLYGSGVASYLSIEDLVGIMNQFGEVVLEQYEEVNVQDGEAPGQKRKLSKGDAENRVKWTEGVEPAWKLNVVPEGGQNQEIDKPFSITIWAQSSETGSIDTDASFTLTSFSFNPDILEFSTDGMKTWTKTPEILLNYGQANLSARGNTEGGVAITVEGENCEPATASINLSVPKEKKQIELLFTDPDGSGEETIIFEFEEK
ncbi:FecR domain-containing protein [Candidatus Latescibacterota bacterium]